MPAFISPQYKSPLLTGAPHIGSNSTWFKTKALFEAGNEAKSWLGTSVLSWICSLIWMLKNALWQAKMKEVKRREMARWREMRVGLRERGMRGWGRVETYGYCLSGNLLGSSWISRRAKKTFFNSVKCQILFQSWYYALFGVSFSNSFFPLPPHILPLYSHISTLRLDANHLPSSFSSLNSLPWKAFYLLACKTEMNSRAKPCFNALIISATWLRRWQLLQLLLIYLDFFAA